MGGLQPDKYAVNAPFWLNCTAKPLNVEVYQEMLHCVTEQRRNYNIPWHCGAIVGGI
jgi:hypothetical protein